MPYDTKVEQRNKYFSVENGGSFATAHKKDILLDLMWWIH